MTRNQVLAGGFLGFAALGVVTWLLIRPPAEPDAGPPRPRPTSGSDGVATADDPEGAAGAAPRLGKPHYVRLVDAETGAPVAWASVAAGSNADLGLTHPTAGAVRPYAAPPAAGESDRSGLAALYQRNGLARLGLAWSEDYAPIVFPLSAAATTLEDLPSLPMSRAGRVDVVVQDDDGVPTSGVRVTLHVPGGRLVHPEGSPVNLPALGWSASTDRAGRCALRGLPTAVPLAVRLEGAGGRAVDLPQPVLLTPGETRSVTWVLGGGAEVQGRLQRADGEPLAGRLLWLLPAYEQGDALLRPEQRAERTARTDAEGRFRFEDVPDGDWWVGPAPTPSGGGAQDGVANLARFVRVGRGERSIELLVMAHEERWIEGRAVDETGAGVVVDVTAIFRDGAGRVETRTDAGGHFRIGPLPPGRFRLLTEGGEGRTCPPLEVRAGERQVRLELQRAAALQVSVVDARTGEPVAASLSLVGHAQDGAFRQSTHPGGPQPHVEEGLPRGRYTILARTADGRAGLLEDLDLDPDRGATQARVEVRPGARVRVRYRGHADFLQYAAYLDGRRLSAGFVSRAESAVEVLPPGAYRFELIEAGSGVVVQRSIAGRSGGECELIHPPK